MSEPRDGVDYAVLLLNCSGGHYLPWPDYLKPLPYCGAKVGTLVCNRRMDPVPGAFVVMDTADAHEGDYSSFDPVPEGAVDMPLIGGGRLRPVAETDVLVDGVPHRARLWTYTWAADELADRLTRPNPESVT